MTVVGMWHLWRGVSCGRVLPCLVWRGASRRKRLPPYLQLHRHSVNPIFVPTCSSCWKTK